MSVDLPSEKSWLPNHSIDRGFRLSATPAVAHFGPKVLNKRRSISASWLRNATIVTIHHNFTNEDCVSC